MRIVSPEEGATVPRGEVVISVYATGAEPVRRVEFHADDVLMGADTAAQMDTFRFAWNASQEALGSTHTIRVQAQDEKGNAASASRTLVLGPGPTCHSVDPRINETWYPSGNPHVVTRSLALDDVTLTIKPGCVVQFDTMQGLTCAFGRAAALIAEGTTDSAIVFTALQDSQPGSWAGLGFYSQTSPATNLDHCRIEYAGVSAGAAVRIFGGNLSIRNTLIRSSAGSGVMLQSGTGSWNGEFSDNTITGCAGYPIHTGPAWAGYFGPGNQLTGNAQDAVEVEGGWVRHSQTWRNHGVPYRLSGHIWIGDPSNQPVLTIAPGSTLRMNRGNELLVGVENPGGLIADGSGGMITITSESPAPTRGDWNYIGFEEQAIDSQCRITHCKIEYGGSGGELGNIYILNAMPLIRDDSIGHSRAWGIYLFGTEYPDPESLRLHNTFYDNPEGEVHPP